MIYRETSTDYQHVSRDFKETRKDEQRIFKRQTLSCNPYADAIPKIDFTSTFIWKKLNWTMALPENDEKRENQKANNICAKEKI